MVHCSCGLKVVIGTSWTNRNPGHRFYGCPTLTPTCVNFLWWFDSPMCQRSVQIIPRFLRSRNKLEEILAMTQREAQLANELSNLTMQLVQSIDERRSFIQEFERLSRNLEAYKIREELKGLQKDDLIKAMEMRKVVLQLCLQIHKDVDFYKTL
ncbi:hypothetical protein Tco_0611167 [Tanacetum coccineum]